MNKDMTMYNNKDDDEKCIDSENKKCKIIVDDGLRKICPWLLWIGVDTVYFAHHNDGDKFLELFEIARKEKRIVFTVNKHMAMRSNCPQYVLFDAKLAPKDCFKHIVHYLKLDKIKLTKQECHDLACDILLCWICMKQLQQVINVNNIDFSLLSQHDLDIFNENQSRTDIQWHRCVQCHRLLYFEKGFIEYSRY